MKLVIVESPSKSSTIQKYLPSDFEVEASLGHIRDLPHDEEKLPDKYQDRDWAYLGVNVEDDFEPFYIVDSHETISNLKKKVKKADEVYLATDEDREGEAISWHLKEVLDPSVPVHRMTFHEITKSAIQKALNNTRDIDGDLVDAQEARRILDRLVGFPLSHLVGEKIKFGLSAGRVQSVAVSLLVDKERERRKFTEHEYWDLTAEFQNGNDKIEADLKTIDGDRIAQGKDFDSKTGAYKNKGSTVWVKEKDAEKLKSELDGAKWEVDKVEENSFSSSPKPPFITSTLQRKASYKLNMSPSYTMSVAQSLYERGLITYHRTDDVSLSKEAQKAARSEAYQLYGDEYVHDKTRYYSSSSSAQQAHEAIRPAGKDFTHPNKAGLSGKKYKLYRMIWQRTVASQMEDAEKTTVKAYLTSKASNRDITFVAKGTRVDFAGFIGSYYMGKNNPEKLINENRSIPSWDEGDILTADSLDSVDHETKPPSRYTEPSLIKELEKKEIGRPSTYASIMRKISQDGKYAKKDGKTMVPTFMGIAVTDFLKDHFPELVDTDFTADMEGNLDSIAEGKKEKVEYLKSFWDAFENQIEKAKEEADEGVKELDLHDFSGRAKVGYYGAYAEVDDNGQKKTVSIPEDISPSDLDEDDIEELLEEQEKEPDSLGEDPDSGKEVLLKEGEYGHYLQLGVYDEDDNSDPKTASVPDSIDPDDVTLQLALRMFDLPRYLGDHPYDDEPVEAGIGPYGPYVRHGEGGDYEYKNLEDIGRVFDITFSEAMDRFKKDSIQDFGEHPDSGDRLRILDGPYGEYIKHGDENIGLPDSVDPKKVDKDKVLDIIDGQ